MASELKGAGDHPTAADRAAEAAILEVLVAAGAALGREAGGVVTDWMGGDAWLANGDVLAGPASVHRALLQLAASPPDR